MRFLSFASFSAAGVASFCALKDSIAFAWSASRAILESATRLLDDIGRVPISPMSSTARAPLIVTSSGATPLRWTPALFAVTRPSLSSLVFVLRLEETDAEAGEWARSGSDGFDFSAAMVANEMGFEGATFVRFGRGIACLRTRNLTVMCVLREESEVLVPKTRHDLACGAIHWS